MEKYVIFGAGETGIAAIDIFGRENIEFFMDNSEQKQLDGIEGYTVYSPEKGCPMIGDSQVVIAVMPQYENEIRAQLAELGIHDVLSAAEIIFERTKKSILERKDYIDLFNKAKTWIFDHVIDDIGICVNSTEMNVYPEVTGYFIPSLLRWGYKDLAVKFAKGLMKIQRNDGAWNGPNDESPYVFDTAQILKGLNAIRELVPEAEQAAIRGADWILSNMSPEGRLTTPDMSDWGEDEDTCSELIHLYCLSPLVEISDYTGDEKYRNAANKIISYYLDNYRDRIVNFRHLSHFHAYLIEALLDMGEKEVAIEAMHNMEAFQKESGAVPAYNNCDWVCSTGLFQLAMIWFRIGDVERGNKAFRYACNLQNDSGGWFGSYISEENPQDKNTYFPLSEISWANKYFLDALYWKNKTEFEELAPQFLDSIDKQDGRYEIISDVIKGVSERNGGYPITVTDIGCGKGRYAKEIVKDYSNVSINCVDISKEVMRGIEDDRLYKIEGTITSIPLEDGMSDVSYCCECLEHAIDIFSAINEMVRITKKGGIIAIIDKNKEKLGRFSIDEWEQWFDGDELKSIMLKYCAKVDIIKEISYEDVPSDGLFYAWIGEVM